MSNDRDNPLTSKTTDDLRNDRELFLLLGRFEGKLDAINQSNDWIKQLVTDLNKRVDKMEDKVNGLTGKSIRNGTIITIVSTMLAGILVTMIKGE